MRSVDNDILIITVEEIKDIISDYIKDHSELELNDYEKKTIESYIRKWIKKRKDN